MVTKWILSMFILVAILGAAIAASSNSAGAITSAERERSYIIAETFEVPSLQTIEVTTFCSAGDRLTTGGYKSRVSTLLQVDASHPVMKGEVEGWHIQVFNGSRESTDKMTTVVLCRGGNPDPPSPPPGDPSPPAP